MNSTNLRSPKRERDSPLLARINSGTTLPLLVGEDNDLSKKLKSRLYSSNPLASKATGKFDSLQET
jgi:hypothetical protein